MMIHFPFALSAAPGDSDIFLDAMRFLRGMIDVIHTVIVDLVRSQPAFEHLAPGSGVDQLGDQSFFLAQFQRLMVSLATTQQT